ncbi:MAG TPA: hypothetical protein VIY48_18440, partial [Candidatus Paceibacterota bacterium]
SLCRFKAETRAGRRGLDSPRRNADINRHNAYFGSIITIISGHLKDHALAIKIRNLASLPGYQPGKTFLSF